MRAQALEGLEVTKDVFIIGSLTGDSLIRFAYGGCIYAAGKLMQSDFNKLNGFGAKTAKSQDWTTENAFINGTEEHNHFARIENESEKQADTGRETHVSPDSMADPPKSWWEYLFSFFTD